MSMQFVSKSLPLSEAGLKDACRRLGVDVAQLWAVIHVETTGCGFLENRQPKILFERHIFSRETDGKFDDEHSDISNPEAGGYGRGGVHQYERLLSAIKLDAEAALRSASWGIGQIMGFNARAAGFADVNAMVTGMIDSEDSQLLAMANFLKDSKLDVALQKKDWTRFACGYNGPSFERNNYDKRLKAAFAQYSVLLPDLTVRAAQVILTYLEFDPGPIDGVIGRRTRDALLEFQSREHLSATGDADLGALDRLRSKVVQTSTPRDFA